MMTYRLPIFIIGLFVSISLPAFAQEPASGDTPAPTGEATPEATNTETAPPAPTDGDAAPADGEATPADGEAAPADGEATPADGEAAPVDGEATDGEATPEDGEAAPTEMTPVEEAKPQTPAPDIEPEAAQHSGGHGAFTVQEMWSQSSGPVKAVLAMLLIMLVGSIGVAIERILYLGAAKRQSRELSTAVVPFFKSNETGKALQMCIKKEYARSYFGHQLKAGLTEYNQFSNLFGVEATERALNKHSVTESPLLNKGLNILATTGATAPFVGLVGTIFGIINAFGQIGAEGGADLTTLAPAIGEALITTAFGIIVAIVGVWLFNYFTAMIESVTNDLSISGQELLDWCYKNVEANKNSAAK